MTKIRSRDASRIQDRRGRGGGGGGGLPGGLPGGLGDLLKGGLGGGARGGGRGLPIPGGAGGMGKLLKGGGGLMMILVLGAVFILPKLLGGAATATNPNLAPASQAHFMDTVFAIKAMERAHCVVLIDAAPARSAIVNPCVFHTK